MRIAPENIQNLGPNEIFVFGSNLAGAHGGGAARMAHKQFGAVWGKGVGLHGHSYALPTMNTHLDRLTIKEIQLHVNRLYEVIEMTPELQFYITKVGCGIAGFTIEEIAPLFKKFMELENCYLPKEFL